MDERLEVDLGRQNLLWTKRTALPQQIPTMMDEKRGGKLTEVRWIESCLAVISERKNEPRKDCDAGRDWGQEEKGMTEDEMAGWHH